MLGDVNLFLVPENDGGVSETTAPAVVGEIEIMIARREARNRGLGLETLCLFLWYIWTHRRDILDEYSSGANLVYLRVKIDATNSPSIRLFERVGFIKVSEEPNYFDEIEMRWDGEHIAPDLEANWQLYTERSSTLSYEDESTS
jgi:RimJ/RimL family protein N-acetyltransferase